jgi:hypothetical protein
MRLLFFFIAILCACLAQAQQTDTSYRILWFKGKKIKANVLLTPQLDTVSYNPQKGRLKLVSKAGNGRKFDLMMFEVNRTPSRINETMTQISKALPKPVAPYYFKPVESAYTSVDRDFRESLANVLELPQVTEENPGLALKPAEAARLAEVNATPGLIKPSDITPDFIRSHPKIQEIVAYYEKVKGETITWVPTPPRTDLAYCNQCDSSIQQGYERDFEVFLQEFAGRDQEFITKILTILREAQLVYSGPALEETETLLFPILNFLQDRLMRKASVLISKYIDDPYRVQAVMRVVLPIERNRQLLGVSRQGDGFFDSFFERAGATMKNFINRAMEEFDYKIALNLEFLLQTERTSQLFGTKNAVGLYRILDFNQFKFHIDVSAKIGGNGGYQLSQVRGDNWMAAIPDSSCKLKWVMLGPDHKELKVKLIAAEIRGPGVQVNYVGTKNWEATKPRFNLEFCDDGKDTVEAFAFHPEDHNELWQYPAPMGVMRMANMSATLDVCFMDVARAKQDAAYYSNPANVAKMKAKLMAQYEQFMKSGGAASMQKATGKAMSAEMQDMIRQTNAMDATNKMREIVEDANPLTYLVKVDAHNKRQLIFKERVNGKEIFPNPATEYAWLHISLEQDPNSPYKGSGLLQR